ncbi:MAG: SurA N-terminal domain-containing protein, partial [Bacteroidales bacterium]|nr:SurA N-terminal domain-containing protein [Bacteroidales bacterium]
MAVIQKIREKSWLLLVLLGLAMILFVVDPSSINTRRPTNTILEIDNNDIEYNQYQQKVNSLEEFSQMQRSAKLDENMRTQIQHQAVEELMNETILENELRKLGLSVHNNELFDMVEGENPHYFVQQLFRNPNTGQVNRAELHNFLKAVIEVEDHPYRQYWLFIEDMIYKGRLREKYNNLVTKGLYATTLEGKRKKIDDTKRVDVLYTPKLYSAISDSSVAVTDADLKKIYDRD